MQDAIVEIIKSIPPGSVFDSHFVIDTLILEHSDVYLTFAAPIGDGPGKTTSVHGHIGKQIALFESADIKRVGESWSRTIHGNAGKCTCWRKL